MTIENDINVLLLLLCAVISAGMATHDMTKIKHTFFICAKVSEQLSHHVL
jgi:hypothetical protein